MNDIPASEDTQWSPPLTDGGDYGGDVAAAAAGGSPDGAAAQTAGRRAAAESISDGASTQGATYRGSPGGDTEGDGGKLPEDEYEDAAAAAAAGGEDAEEYDELPITHGTSVMYKRARFQAHAAPVRSVEDVNFVLQNLLQLHPWDRCTYAPFAYRIAQVMYEDEEIPPEVLEGFDDSNDLGTGERLLGLIQKWDVQNVLLIVCVWDDGLPGALGHERYRIMLERAKAVLEQCYDDAVAAGEAPPPPDPSKRIPEPPSRTIGEPVTLRDGTVAAQAKMTVLNSAAVPWPKDGSVGGIRYGKKVGRPAHFNADPRPEVATKPASIEIPEIPAELILHLRTAQVSVENVLGVISAPSISKEAIATLRGINMPTAGVARLISCIGALVQWSGAVHPSDLSWAECRDMLGNPKFLNMLADLDITRIHPDIALWVHAAMRDPVLDLDRLRRANALAAVLGNWLQHVIDRYFVLLSTVDPEFSAPPQLCKPVKPKGAVSKQQVALGSRVQYSGYTKPTRRQPHVPPLAATHRPELQITMMQSLPSSKASPSNRWTYDFSPAAAGPLPPV